MAWLLVNRRDKFTFTFMYGSKTPYYMQSFLNVGEAIGHIFCSCPFVGTLSCASTPDSNTNISILDINWPIFLKLGVNMMTLKTSPYWYCD